MKTTLAVVGVIAFLVILAAISIPLGIADWWVNDPNKGAIAVGKQEFNAQEMLRKYEWFKDAAAQLDAKRADISVYEQRLAAIDRRYPDSAQMPRVTAEQYTIWQSEVAGVKANYNSLAAEYNAQMSKFNWRFANRGDLPAGATDPLPREFKPYTNQ